MKPHFRLKHQLLAHLSLAGILGLSLALNLSNVGFPLGFHFDEPLKIDFIKMGLIRFGGRFSCAG